MVLGHNIHFALSHSSQQVLMDWKKMTFCFLFFVCIVGHCEGASTILFLVCLSFVGNHVEAFLWRINVSPGLALKTMPVMCVSDRSVLQFWLLSSRPSGSRRHQKVKSAIRKNKTSEKPAQGNRTMI